MFESACIPGPSGLNIDRVYPQASSSRGIRWYYKLESSMSSVASEEDTESIYSIQGYETEYIQDTPDTDTKSEYSSSASDNDNFEVEYEVVESDEENDPPYKDSSSSGDDEVITVAAAGAIALLEESLTSWATEVEEDSDSSIRESEIPEQFLICSQCNSRNTNPRFRICLKCFQMRKNLYEPPPKGHRKRKAKKEDAFKRPIPTASGSKENEVQPLSQDSAYASQEFSSQEITEPAAGSSRGVKRKSEDYEEDSSKRLRIEEEIKKTEEPAATGLSRVKRKSSESEEDLSKRVRTDTQESLDPIVKKEEFLKPTTPAENYPLYDNNRSCILCVKGIQSALFLHTGIACLCCCYNCAKRTWRQHKKCPMCTRKVKSVIRINRA